MAHALPKYVKKDLPRSLKSRGLLLLVVGVALMAGGIWYESHKAAHSHHASAVETTSVDSTISVDGTVAEAHAEAGVTEEAPVNAGHHGPGRLWAYGYLIMFGFLLSVIVGNIFYVGLEYMMNANWSSPIRRVHEFYGQGLIWLAVLALPFFLGKDIGLGLMSDVFSHWVYMPLDDQILQGKKAFLNPTAFGIIFFSILAIWGIFNRGFFSRSIKQDETGDQMLTHKSLRRAPVFILVFALTFTLVAVYFFMSLNPHWFSTMWGIYYWSGTVTVAMAVALFSAIHLFEKGYLHPAMHKHTFYNMSGLLFGFNAFWAYVAFCQFMLIWYGNLPEETVYFIPRWEGPWVTFTIVLIIVHFVVPLFALVPRRSKTNLGLLKFMSIWLIIAHILDLIFMVLPHWEGEGVGALDFVFALGFPCFAFGFLMVLFASQAAKYNMVPIKDPRLAMGLGFRLTTVDSDD